MAAPNENGPHFVLKYIFIGFVEAICFQLIKEENTQKSQWNMLNNNFHSFFSASSFSSTFYVFFVPWMCCAHDTIFLCFYIRPKCLLYQRLVKVHEFNNWILSGETWQRRTKKNIYFNLNYQRAKLFPFNLELVVASISSSRWYSLFLSLVSVCVQDIWRTWRQYAWLCNKFIILERDSDETPKKV